MIPVLLDLGFIKIYTFGVFLVLAFLWTAYFVWKNVQLTSFKENQVFDGLFISLGVGLVVARIVYIAFHFNDFGFDPLKYALINGYPGLSLFGGMVGFFGALYLFCLSQKLRFLDMCDYIVAPLFLALAIGKMGSFFAGVEVGSRTEFFLAIKYTNFDGLRHLTAFYEGLLFFLGSYICYLAMFEIRKSKSTLSKGFNFVFFLWFFSAVQAVVDGIKTNPVMIQGWSVYFAFALFILLTSSVFLLYYFKDFFFDRLAKR